MTANRQGHIIFLELARFCPELPRTMPYLLIPAWVAAAPDSHNCVTGMAAGIAENIAGLFSVFMGCIGVRNNQHRPIAFMGYDPAPKSRLSFEAALFVRSDA